jgi:hypothetical protein
VPPPQSEKNARQQKARRRHHGKTIEGEERDVTSDLLLKHPYRQRGACDDFVNPELCWLSHSEMLIGVEFAYVYS